jgi:hypothetical protein
MDPAYRNELIGVMAHVEQLMAEAKALTVKAPDDETVLQASALIAEHKRLISHLEDKLARSRPR